MNYVIYVRKNKENSLMPPQIVIKYKSGATTVLTCHPTEKGPWTKEDVQKHLDYFNGLWEVHKAYVKP